MTSIDLQGLPDDKAQALRAIAHYLRFEKLQSVFRDGDRYKGPFIVAEGQFKIFMIGDGGKEAIMHIFREGELIAGGPLFLGGVYPASCAALTDGCLISFEYDQQAMEGPPFSVTTEEIQQQYGQRYDITVLASLDVPGGLKGRCPATERVYVLRKGR